MTTQDTADSWIEAGIDSECVRHIVREWSTVKDAATLAGIDTTQDDWPEAFLEQFKALKESERRSREFTGWLTRALLNLRKGGAC